jgi:hypothetical protein
VPGVAGRRLIERLWILGFILAGFLFGLLAPPIAGIPLAAMAGGLAGLNAYVYRRLVGAPWVTAAFVFGSMWVVISVAAAVTGAATGLEVFGP